MNEEKRKIGEYTVLCSVNVGEKEIILASNEQSTNGDKFLCGFAERDTEAGQNTGNAGIFRNCDTL